MLPERASLLIIRGDNITNTQRLDWPSIHSGASNKTLVYDHAAELAPELAAGSQLLPDRLHEPDGQVPDRAAPAADHADVDAGDLLLGAGDPLVEQVSGVDEHERARLTGGHERTADGRLARPRRQPELALLVLEHGLDRRTLPRELAGVELLHVLQRWHLRATAKVDALNAPRDEVERTAREDDLASVDLVVEHLDQRAVLVLERTRLEETPPLAPRHLGRAEGEDAVHLHDAILP
jgi:hypothetical protein